MGEAFSRGCTAELLSLGIADFGDPIILSGGCSEPGEMRRLEHTPALYCDNRHVCRHC